MPGTKKKQKSGSPQFNLKRSNLMNMFDMGGGEGDGLSDKKTELTKKRSQEYGGFLTILKKAQKGDEMFHG